MIEVLDAEDEYGVYKIDSWKAKLVAFQYVDSVEDFKIKSFPFDLDKATIVAKGEEFKLEGEDKRILKGGRFALYPTG
ncbi:MAG: hypothetical protein ACQEP3_03190 [Patescibacteria group bacterium]